jgi:hypothetical protein
MIELKPDDQIWKIREPLNLISHEKAFMKLDTGCVWTCLLLDGRKVGVAYRGPSNFAVDAITETDQGAVGTSMAGELQGIQLYLGDSNLESISILASVDDVRQVGLENQEAFIQEINSRIDKIRHKDSKIDISEHEGHILLGNDSEDKTIVLVVKRDGLVFTYNKTTYVTSDSGSVSVDSSGIYIGGSNGESIAITKHGISGLEGLRELRALKDLGPSISRAVAKSMKQIKSAKQSFRGFKHGPVWDDVDSFDWDDD